MNEIEVFAALAEEYCRWVEGAPGPPDVELQRARGFAARLYTQALTLPEGTCSTEEASSEPCGWDYSAAFERFSCLPVGMYSCVDPLQLPGTDCLTGDVGDDLADVYLDLRRGLEHYRAGRTQDAAWDWSFSFHSHWGAHVTAALVALHAVATR